MRPYRRKRHSSWRTRRRRGIIGEVSDYLEPFVHGTKAIWRLEPPFPLTAKVFITAVTWFLLFLPLCYFLVPAFAAYFLLNFFSGRTSPDRLLTVLGEFFARATWPKTLVISLRVIDKLTIAFFLYDYYQILSFFINWKLLVWKRPQTAGNGLNTLVFTEVKQYGAWLVLGWVTARIRVCFPKNSWTCYSSSCWVSLAVFSNLIAALVWYFWMALSKYF